jgi:hypothetical protein
VRELAQRGHRALGLVEPLGHERGAGGLRVPERPARQLERDHGVDEALLRPVVQIAHHSPALLVGRRDDPRA